MAIEITDLPLCASIDENDLFVTVQQNKYVHNRFNTCSIQSNTLVDMLCKKILDIRKFDTMAYSTSNDFSPYVHNHDNLYNKISVDFEYDASTKNALALGYVFINGQLKPLYAPLAQPARPIPFDEPKVGMLKFVATTNISSNNDIQYKSSQFDGWLYPDGSTFMLSDFTLSNQLQNLYSNDTIDTFTLPDLRKFIRCNNCNDSTYSNQISSIDKRNELKLHSHPIDLLCDIDATIKLSLPTCNWHYGNAGGKVFGGNGIVGVKFNSNHDVIYDGKRMKLNDLLSILRLGVISSSITTNLWLKKIWYVTIDDLDTICKALDAANGTKLYESVKYLNSFRTNPIDEISISGSILLKDGISVSTETSGNDDETYPSYVVLPVMIYVGKRESDFS